MRQVRLVRVTKLQWGRGFAATEGRILVVGAELVDRASMGPWLRSHGRLGTGKVTGKTKLLQWGRGFAATEG